jgi:hypothetical protein
MYRRKDRSLTGLEDLFICTFFSNFASISEYKAWNGTLVIALENAWRESGNCLIRGIIPEFAWKVLQINKISVRTIGAPADIRTGHLPMQETDVTA